MQTIDQRIFSILNQQDQTRSPNNGMPKQYGSAFIVHVVFKVIPIAIMWLRSVLTPLISKTIIIQLVLLFVVLDFWLTKNITGRRMLGLRWAFQEDEFGDEKFQFQGRVNEEFVSSLSTKLFWIVLLAYMIVPILSIVFGILSVASIWRMKLDDILLYVVILMGGGINFFFFWRARQGVKTRRAEMTSKLGNDFVNQMGMATVVSYF